MTGTFDSWSKSVKLDKVGDGFAKTVSLADASKKIYYKVRLPSLCRTALARVVCLIPRPHSKLRAVSSAPFVPFSLSVVSSVSGTGELQAISSRKAQ